ncbi:MAG: hypothetical protein JWO06_247 [Bacteroidota bacterium]|nr:hypothetical protein [Bacteroidota bacterium]
MRDIVLDELVYQPKLATQRLALDFGSVVNCLNRGFFGFWDYAGLYRLKTYLKYFLRGCSSG